LLKEKYIAIVLRFLLVNLALVLCIQIQSQDFHFTQFYANKLYLAPSFAGATEQNRIITNYRNQWPGVNGYTTYSVSFDRNFQNFNSGIGVLVMRDMAGDGKLGTLNIGLAYSYDFALTDFVHFRPGLSLSYIQRCLDYSKLTFSSQLGGTTDSNAAEETFAGNAPIGAIDASTSGILYSKNWMFGLTLDHLLTPNLSFLGNEDRLPFKISTYGSITLYRYGRLLKPVDETVTFAYNVKAMKKFIQTDVGLYWAQIPFTFGLWYRGIPVVNSDRGDSFALLVGFKKQHLSIGYSYDFTISNLVNKTAGTHEISMAYEFAKVRTKSMHAVPCPEF